MSFFDSRWVEAPAAAVEISGLPKGFRAAGVRAGLKASGKRDVGLLLCDSNTPVSAARFTRSGVQAAPVLVCREQVELTEIRAVIVNSGQANVSTGARGIEIAQKTQSAVAAALELEPSAVAVCSTGVIGVPPELEPLVDGAVAATKQLSVSGDIEFEEAICTTDIFTKQVSLELELPSGVVKLAAQAKGAGMISPAFATMLCFIETDAVLDAGQVDLLLDVGLDRSFNRVTVDGQLSTNDTAILIASGASGVTIEPDSEDERLFAEAFDAVLRQLAVLLVRDGEGAKRVGRVVVSGGDPDSVEHVAREVGNSPLVKAALHGGDPNWGRIAGAVGMALPGSAPLPVDIWIEGEQVCRDGAATDFNQYELGQQVSGTEIEYEIRLPGTGSEAELFFSDLSHEYVTVNSEYTT